MLTRTKPNTSHVCVAVDGSYMYRGTYATLRAMGHTPFVHATVRLRPGEQPEDAVRRHQQAERRYWASL